MLPRIEMRGAAAFDEMDVDAGDGRWPVEVKRVEVGGRADEVDETWPVAPSALDEFAEMLSRCL